jgi:hypothetical protein
MRTPWPCWSRAAIAAHRPFAKKSDAKLAGGRGISAFSKIFFVYVLIFVIRLTIRRWLSDPPAPSYREVALLKIPHPQSQTPANAVLTR